MKKKKTNENVCTICLKNLGTSCNSAMKHSHIAILALMTGCHKTVTEEEREMWINVTVFTRSNPDLKHTNIKSHTDE